MLPSFMRAMSKHWACFTLLSRAPSSCPAWIWYISGIFDSASEIHLVKYSEVEVVVVVSNRDVTAGSHANTDGEIGNALPANLTQVVALVVKHLYTVGSVVADEHFLVVIHCHTIGEFKMPEVGMVFNQPNVLHQIRQFNTWSKRTWPRHCQPCQRWQPS